MPRTRNLILPVEIKPAKRLCRCSRNKDHLIPSNNLRLVVKESGGIGEKGYCGPCAQTMLAAAKQRVEELQAAFAPAANRDYGQVPEAEREPLHVQPEQVHQER